MQTLKEDIKHNILAAAKAEFLKYGFDGAAVRRITKSAKTSTSNVYNYFQDKNALFTAVVEPALSGLEAAFAQFRLKNPERSAGTYTMAAQKDAIGVIMHLVFEFEDEFRLLLLGSAGSSLSGFKKSMTNSLSAILIDWVHFAAPDKAITDFFIRSVSGFYISVIEQLLAERRTIEQATPLLPDFLTFVYGGWKALLESNRKK